MTPRASIRLAPGVHKIFLPFTVLMMILMTIPISVVVNDETPSHRPLTVRQKNAVIANNTDSPRISIRHLLGLPRKARRPADHPAYLCAGRRHRTEV